MKRLNLLLIISALAVTLNAQADRHSGQGYAFVAPHATGDEFGNILSLGAGGEVFLYRGLAAGSDIAYVFPRGYANEGIGLLTLNPSYHFVNAERSNRFAPFVTGGYALAFRGGAASLFNFGGGTHYWFSRRLGVRFEVRNYRTTTEVATTEFRFGIAFR